MAGNNIERQRAAQARTEEDRDLTRLVNVYGQLSKDMDNTEAAGYRQAIYDLMGLTIANAETADVVG